MSIMAKLRDTFDTAYAGREVFETLPWPPGHIETQTDIEIRLDQEGNFLSAQYLTQEYTLHPATEESAGRTSGPAPHPLCDKIQYVAGDYTDYDKNETSYFDDSEKVREGYMTLLSRWEDFSRHPMLTAIRRYVGKRSVVRDLIGAGIFFLGADKKLSEKWEGKKPVKDAFIRWRVQARGNENDKVWNNPELIASWIEFYKSCISETVFCYITGDDALRASNQPARLRYGGDKAKLISSNDSSGYTFRGHFLTAEEACSIGYEATQKAHSALRWIIGRQGFRNDTQTIVAWAVSNAPLPDINASTNDIGGEDDSWPSDAEDYESGETTDIGQAYALKLVQKLRGYKKELKDRDDVVVMAMDSATTGRMGITYYREIKGSDFLARVEDYHRRYAWAQNLGKDRRFVGAPALKDIAKMICAGKPDSSLTKATISRLIPVIVDGVPIPHDIVASICRKAACPMGKENWEHAAVLGIACGLYAGSHIERGYKMSLEENRRTRDYLYGRLLAVADKLEGHALSISSEGKNRDTSAVKLMQRFSSKPYETWEKIELSLLPYMSRLQARAPKSLTFYNGVLNEIYDLFQDGDFTDNSPLTPEFLLGYHCQMSKLWKKEKDPDEAAPQQL